VIKLPVLLLLAWLVIAPTQASTQCTRGTNSYQDLKDQLNLVNGDLHDASTAVHTKDVAKVKRIAARLKADWKLVMKESKRVQRPIPRDLNQNVGTAIESIDSVSGEILLVLAKKINDLSMAMTCPE